MRWYQYYWRWCVLAFKHSFGFSDAIAGALGMAIPLLLRQILNTSKAEAFLTDLVWQIPLGILSTLTIVRLGLAPYWMYKEDQIRKIPPARLHIVMQLLRKKAANLMDLSEEHPINIDKSRDCIEHTAEFVRATLGGLAEREFRRMIKSHGGDSFDSNTENVMVGGAGFLKGYAQRYNLCDGDIETGFNSADWED